MKRCLAFTLIELLVVITIIVVLLALLTPALDKAVYEAELTTCGAQMRGVASGVTTYAAEYKRHYPDRPEFHDGRSANPNWLNMPANNAARRGAAYDVRPKLRPYMAIKSLGDPLAPRVDLAGTNPEVCYVSNYGLWSDWAFTGYKRLSRLGESFSWSAGSGAPLYRFNVLVDDKDFINAGAGAVQASHPDSEGKLITYLYDQLPDVVSGALLGFPNFKVTATGWYSATTIERGPSDYSYASTDTSVERFNRVVYQSDPRMVAVPVESAAANEETAWRHLPPK